MKFCIIIDLFDLKATRKEIAENFAMYFILFDLKKVWRDFVCGKSLRVRSALSKGRVPITP